MKYLLGLFLAYSLSFTSAPKRVESPNTQVYICDSSGATKYHYTKSCRGLNACKHQIIKVSLTEAIKKGKKTLCGWED